MNPLQGLARACALARRALGDVEPNPVVGAVLLSEAGEVVGEGWHRDFGGPHAEVHALAEAGVRARGATLCVTLEPCSTTGKTGPCTEAVLAAGVGRVLVGCTDPNPRHQGRGLERLLAAGVHVDLVDLPEAHELLRHFQTSLAARRPHVLAKWAMSKDGAIAPSRGEHARISCEASRQLVHRWRGHLDALVVGVNTVIVDDPLLTARGDQAQVRPLRRVVLDPSLRTPPFSQVVRTAFEVPTWIYAGDDAPEEAEAALVEHGVMVRRLPRQPDGRSDWLPGVFADLRLQGVQRVMVEGGSHTLATCLAADLIDQCAIFMAPRQFGNGSVPAVEGLSLGCLSPHEVATALHLSDCRVSQSGQDVLLRGFRN